MSIITDFPSIARHARLKALDGTPQNVVQPMGVETAGFGHLSCCAVNNGPALPVGPCDCGGVSPDPVEFDGYGMYMTHPEVFAHNMGPTHAGRVTRSIAVDGITLGGGGCGTRTFTIAELPMIDTAPSEWSAPEQDPA